LKLRPPCIGRLWAPERGSGVTRVEMGNLNLLGIADPVLVRDREHRPSVGEGDRTGRRDNGGPSVVAGATTGGADRPRTSAVTESSNATHDLRP
jgi:hypothetical protein